MTAEQSLREACWHSHPGNHVLVMLRKGSAARLVLAVANQRNVYAMACPTPEDMYSGFARVVGNRWAEPNGGVMVWAYRTRPHEMSAFVGPPEATLDI